jgi:hypothetical protein
VLELIAPYWLPVTVRLLAWSLALQGLEAIRLAPIWGRRFPASAWGSAHGLLTVPRSDLGLRVAAGLLLLGAVWLAWRPSPAPLALACLSHFWLCARLGGTINGGSDTFTQAVALPLFAPLAFPQAIWADHLAALLIGTQLLLSYTIAGFAKLRNRSWRDGTALIRLALLPHYEVPAWSHAIVGRAGLARLLCLIIVAWECSAPLSVLTRPLCIAYLGAALVFHAGVALTLRLHRFFWAWLAAFPALLRAQELLAASPASN